MRVRSGIRSSVLAGACLAAALAACTPPPTASTVASIKACFPPEASSWISVQPIAVTEAAGPAAGRAAGAVPAKPGVTVYVDGSGSMAGYLRGGGVADRPFPALLEAVPSAAAAMASSVRHVRFGAQLRELTGDGVNALSRPETYACNGRPGCDNQESHIDQVLRRIAGSPEGELSVVVSDLWLTNSDLTSSPSVALNGPLRDILASGRDIAIYGFVSPYAATVDGADMPSGRPHVVSSSHPLFVLVIGPAKAIAAFDEQMRISPNSYIASALSGGQVRRSVFSTRPAAGGDGEAEPLRGDHPLLARQAVLEAMPGLEIQQFVLSRAAVRNETLRAQRSKSSRSTRGPAKGPVWTGPRGSALTNGAVWAGEVQTGVRAWRLKGDFGACSAKGWRHAATFSEGWTASEAGQTFELSPDRLAARLGAGVYLLVGEVRSDGLVRPNPATAWMREWSFNATGEAAVRGNGSGLFPTLNLAETARLLENAILDARSAPRPIDGFAVVVKVQN